MRFSIIFSFKATLAQEIGATELQVYHKKLANFMQIFQFRKISLGAPNFFRHCQKSYRCELEQGDQIFEFGFFDRFSNFFKLSPKCFIQVPIIIKSCAFLRPVKIFQLCHTHNIGTVKQGNQERFSTFSLNCTNRLIRMPTLKSMLEENLNNSFYWRFLMRFLIKTSIFSNFQLAGNSERSCYFI